MTGYLFFYFKTDVYKRQVPKNTIPESTTIEPKNLPTYVVGTISPYPIVEMVINHHQSAFPGSPQSGLVFFSTEATIYVESIETKSKGTRIKRIVLRFCFKYFFMEL